MPAVATPPAASSPTRTSVDQLEIRARRDFIWTAAHLLKIRPKDPYQPLMPLRLNWPQRYIAENYLIPAHQRGIPLGLSILKARREGVSTLMLAWMFHKVRWFRGRNAMVYAHTDKTLTELFEMIPRFDVNLPPEMQLEKDRDNTQELGYKALDSRIGRNVAGHRDIGRGQTIHHALLSEIDFYENPLAVLPGIREAVPTTGPSTIIYETTANGDGGYFHEHWKALKKKKGQIFGNRYWFPVFLPWYWHPDHQTPDVPRDWEPDEEEYELMVRYKLSRPQLYWYHQKGVELETDHPGRGLRLRAQEYPSNDQECFLVSGQCIFPEEALKALEAQQAPPRFGFQLVRTADRRVDLVKHDPQEAALQVWEPPQPGYEYAIGVDVARGGGGDDSCIEVLRMPGFKQVAEWYDNFTSPRQLAFIVAAIARYYALPNGISQPIINVELNADGLFVNEELSDMVANGAPFSLYVWEPFDRMAPPPVTPASRTGWITTHVSKNMLISIANSLLFERLVHIPSVSLQQEMGRTMEVRLGVAATRGADQVMAWLFALVTCYRKIARWSWPGESLRQEDEAQQERITNPVVQDTTYEQILRPRGWADGWEVPGSVRNGGWLLE